MELTFMTELGQSFVIEIDPNMELENVMALLEAESGIPVHEQGISHEGRELENPKATVAEAGVTGPHAMLLLRKKVQVGGKSIGQDAEMMRLQVLGDPELMRQLDETQPEVAAAARNDPSRFAELLAQTAERQHDAELARQREIEQLNADPYDVEAQRRIEEAIRQQAVIENMNHAIEYSPESFGRVTMLYISVEVNSHPVMAFVDSGAQSTIMSPECAEACGIMRLIDTRFAGIARGVGTAKILGRVHSAQIKLSDDLYLPCSFTIMEGRDVDLLLGLDMLKAHQACIDLGKNVLRIQEREVSFLSEHELPDKARDFGAGGGGDGTVEPLPAGAGPSAPASSAETQFPGGGNTIGAPPAAVSRRPPQQQQHRRPAPAATTSTHPEASIQVLMGLGMTREVAISTLDASGGNIDVAASLLF